MRPARQSWQPAVAPPGAAVFFLTDGATVASALQQATDALDGANIDTPRLDAEVLLAHALGISRAALLASLTNPLPAGARSTFEDLIRRRLRHEPVAYLTRRKEFYGLDFYVDHRVLIPRPETELLVDRAIAIHNSRSCHFDKLSAGSEPRRRVTNHNPATSTSSVQALSPVEESQLHVVDVGTGSGCIAIALAFHLPQAEICATEASLDALDVARINVERHGMGNRVHLIRSDLLRDLAPELQFDIIVANLPYVSEAEMTRLWPSVWDYEPVEWALRAGSDGLDLIRRLLEQAPSRLRRGGVALLEVGMGQGVTVSEMARRHFPDAEVHVWPDLAGLDRVVEIHTHTKP